MLLKSPIKILVKEDAILPQGRLVAGSHGDCRFYETAAAFDLGSGPVGIECEGTARDPASLLRDLLVSFAADGEAHGAEPNFHRPAKLDLSGAGPDCLALQEKQDKAGVAAIGQTQALLVPVHAGLQNECQVVTFSPPGCALLRLMWQAGERKAAVGKTHPFRIVAKHPVGGLDNGALVLGDGLPTGLLDAVHEDELMNLGHGNTVPLRNAPRNGGLYGHEAI